MTTMIVLRLFHILSGVFWVGSLVFVSVFLLPAFKSVGPAGGAVMKELTQRLQFQKWILLAGWLTILSGAVMVWRDAGTLGLRWFEQGSGRTFGIGAVLALIATALGMSINIPTVNRIGALTATFQAAGRPPSAEEQAEIQRLQARLGTVGKLVALLLVLAAAAMAIARYTV